MICTSCKKAEAVVFVKHIIGNQVSQAALCVDCAAQAHVPINPVNPLGELLQLLAKPHPPRVKVEPKHCPGCAMTWADFRSSGRLGCPHCYDHFTAQLKSLIPRIHAGAYEHRGKSPKSSEP